MPRIQKFSRHHRETYRIYALTIDRSIDTFLKILCTSTQKLTSSRNGWQRMRRRAHQYQIRNRPRVGVSKKVAASSLHLLLSFHGLTTSIVPASAPTPSPTLHPRLLSFSPTPSLTVAFRANCEMRLRLWCTGSEFTCSYSRRNEALVIAVPSLYRAPTLYRSIRESRRGSLARLSTEQNLGARGFEGSWETIHLCSNDSFVYANDHRSYLGRIIKLSREAGCRPVTER